MIDKPRHCTPASSPVNEPRTVAGRSFRSGRPPAGPVAQWLEPAAHNGLVAGSSPAGPTSLRSLRELRLGKPVPHIESESEQRLPRRSPRGVGGLFGPRASGSASHRGNASVDRSPQQENFMASEKGPNIKKKQKCKNCEGKGLLKKGDRVMKCQRCKGTGVR